MYSSLLFKSRLVPRPLAGWLIVKGFGAPASATVSYAAVREPNQVVGAAVG